MSERNGYRHGVPCGISTVHPDPEQAVGFYTALFGWEATDAMPAGSPTRHYVCTLRGRTVASIGSWSGPDAPAAWGTFVWVDSADETAARVAAAGGSVVGAPFDLLDAGRLAVLADPSGAVFCAWQAREDRGAQLVNEPGAWSWTDLNTRDPEGAKAFYRVVFGWETHTIDMGGGDFTMWRVPGYEGGEPLQPVPRDVVAGMVPTGGEDVAPHWSIDFWVGDVDATVARVAELGGTIVAPAYEIPGAGIRQAVVADPQGAAFSVSRVMVPG